MMRHPALLILLNLVVGNEVWATNTRYGAYQPNMRNITAPPTTTTLNTITLFNAAPNNIKASIATTNNATTYLEYRKLDEKLTHLMAFLIRLTSGRQIYLVYDDIIPGVGGVVRECQEAWVDTTLLPYQPTFALLAETLRAYYHVHPIRNVFVLCSPAHLAALFQKVKEKVLESPTIQWFVIVEEDLTEALAGLLREGTQVALVERVSPGKARLFSSRVESDGKIRVGSWSEKGERNSKVQEVKKALVPNLLELYSDFQGRELLVTTNDNWPFFKINTLDNGTVIPISGIDLQVITAISESLNFTNKLVRPPDGKWGGPQPDGSITGLVGQVARHEAHATLCELTITGARESVVDFTMPYYMESTTLVSNAPKEKNRAFAVFSPFTVGVWMCICAVTAVIGPLLYVLSRLMVKHLEKEDRSQYTMQSLAFNMYRTLMVQGNLIRSPHWTLRFIFVFWYLFSFYIYAMYSATLTAVLAVPSFEKPIDSLEDLAQAHRDGYLIATTRDSSFADAFQTANGGLFNEVWKLFNHRNPDRSFLPAPASGFDVILQRKCVFINAELNSKLTATKKGLNNYYIARRTFLPQGYGIACSIGSPFKEVFSRIIIRLKEAGLVYKWAKDEVKKVAKNNCSPGEAGPKAINLHQLQAAFFILVIGFVISAMVLGGEIITSRLKQSNKTTTSIKMIVSRSEYQPPHPRAAYRNSSIIHKLFPVMRKQ